MFKHLIALSLFASCAAHAQNNSNLEKIHVLVRTEQLVIDETDGIFFAYEDTLLPLQSVHYTSSGFLGEALIEDAQLNLIPMVICPKCGAEFHPQIGHRCTK